MFLSKTFNTICKLEAPNDLEASITPVGTSVNDCSTILAINANEANTNGTTIEYHSPDHLPLPIITLVTGIKTTINSKQGIDLKIFTIVPKIAFNTELGFKPFFEVTYNSTPIGIPST